MRRSRRGGHSGPEFGGSGEDSFVAVVVTKLTGALLFILLLTMVIMALLPKAIDLPRPGNGEETSAPLTITTPDTLPEAIAGHPYQVALAASGGHGPLRWSIDGELPEGLRFDADTGQIQGTPRKGTPKPVELLLRVSDGSDRTARATRLVIYQPDGPLSTPSAWKPALPPIPWRSWLEQGFGFLVLFLVYLVGMNSVSALQRWSASSLPADATAEGALRSLRWRFLVYRATVSLGAVAAATALALWLWRPHG